MAGSISKRSLNPSLKYQRAIFNCSLAHITPAVDAGVDINIKCDLSGAKLSGPMSRLTHYWLYNLGHIRVTLLFDSLRYKMGLIIVITHVLEDCRKN